MRTVTYVSICSVALGVAAAACGDSTGPVADNLALSLNRAKWAAKGLDTYTFEYQRSCGECLPEWVQRVRITVVNGQVTAVNRVPTGESVPPPAFRLTIDSLFVAVASTLQQNPYRFTATYDSRLGYPTAVSVDYDKEMVDDEGGFSARLLTP